MKTLEATGQAYGKKRIQEIEVGSTRTLYVKKSLCTYVTCIYTYVGTHANTQKHRDSDKYKKTNSV